MASVLSPQVILLGFWLVVVACAALFLRLGCSLCQADIPSWPRAVISVVEADGVPVGDDEPEEEEEPAPRKRRRVVAAADGDAAWVKAFALWNEVRPEVRDLLFFASGILLTL